MKPGEQPTKSGNDGPSISSSNDAITGFPGLKTWRAVYLFVLILFAIYVLLLVALERNYS
jgi:hypothetical protein